MRKVHTGKVNEQVMYFIGRNYNKLKAACNITNAGNYCSENMEDIFHDTIQFVIQDEEAATLSTEHDVIDHFLFRFNMVKYQRIMDDKTIKTAQYADYKQPTTGTEG